MGEEAWNCVPFSSQSIPLRPETVCQVRASYTGSATNGKGRTPAAYNEGIKDQAKANRLDRPLEWLFNRLTRFPGETHMAKMKSSDTGDPEPPDDTLEVSEEIAEPATAAAPDPALRHFLDAPEERSAERAFERLDAEFLTPLIKAALSREIFRSVPTTPEANFAELDTYHDLYLLVRGKMAVRLYALRDKRSVAGDGARIGTVARLAPYVITVARHAYVDYLRRKYPGRHALDVSLRAVLESSPVFSLWRHPLGDRRHEWRCGLLIWHQEERGTVSLLDDSALRARLRTEVAKHGTNRGTVLDPIFHLVGQPLRYTELLDFLAEQWNVEAPYLAAARESVPFRVGKPYVSDLHPEAATVGYYGALQHVWESLRPLSTAQAAVLLLKAPPGSRGGTLAEMVRLGIATWDEIAARIGLPVADLLALSEELPLDDEEIAVRLSIPFDEVRRVRQDARRRIERLGQGRLRASAD